MTQKFIIFYLVLTFNDFISIKTADKIFSSYKCRINIKK